MIQISLAPSGELCKQNNDDDLDNDEREKMMKHCSKR